LRGFVDLSGASAVMSLQLASSGTSDPDNTFPRVKLPGLPPRHIVTGSLNDFTTTPSASASCCTICGSTPELHAAKVKEVRAFPAMASSAFLACTASNDMPVARVKWTSSQPPEVLFTGPPNPKKPPSRPVPWPIKVTSCFAVPRPFRVLMKSSNDPSAGPPAAALKSWLCGSQQFVTGLPLAVFRWAALNSSCSLSGWANPAAAIRSRCTGIAVAAEASSSFCSGSSLVSSVVSSAVSISLASFSSGGQSQSEFGPQRWSAKAAISRPTALLPALACSASRSPPGWWARVVPARLRGVLARSAV
jgi:hypothetical protein